MSKISIRFYQKREVRAIWDDENSKWWFSVVDIIAALNEQDDHTKNRNYWKYLKTKLSKDDPELVSGTNQLKLTAPDGKKRALRRCIDWSKVDKNAYLAAMRESVTDSTKLKALLKPALTSKINDHEMFMKGIDYSYYYESDDPAFEPNDKDV